MIQGVHISSAGLTVKKENQIKSDLPLMKKDQVVEATVLKVVSKTRAELLIAGKRVLADTALRLTQGEKIKLKVASEGDRQVLNLVRPAASSTLSLASLLGSFSKENPFSGLEKAVRLLMQESIRPEAPAPSSSDSGIPSKALTGKADINGLRSLISSLAVKSEEPDPGFLPRLLEKGGLFWENRLSKLLPDASLKTENPDLQRIALDDLKGYALKLLSLVEPSDQDAARLFKDFSETIEKFQLLNRYTSESGKYLIPLPIFSDNGFGYGQLLYDSGDKKPGSEERSQGLVKVSFFLTMTRLGPLRVDLSVLNKEISGRFLVSDRDIHKFIQTMLPDLNERLKRHGFRVLQMESQIALPAEISETSLLDAVLEDGDQVLNIVI